MPVDQFGASFCCLLNTVGEKKVRKKFTSGGFFLRNRLRYHIFMNRMVSKQKRIQKETGSNTY